MQLEQNTLAWQNHRKKYINASEVAAIMGLNPFETKEQLLKRKVFGTPIEDNEAMKRGRILEPQARNFFNQTQKMQFEPKVFVKDFMSASLDGWDAQSQSLLEIKCPISFASYTWQSFLNEGKIPTIYYAQLQAQIYCSQSIKAYFLVYQNDQTNKNIEVKEDPNFITNMLEQCSHFFQLYLKTKQLQKQLQI
ncbi:MAG: YqaJ viral recombinase family protein [Candidatus Phytoplasma asteris]|nr:MAG: YqaJ viral recombinase family protein [Candidatus Phytoplasma asteris]